VSADDDGRGGAPVRGRRASDRGIYYAFLALLVWAPWPLGSNRPWAQAVLELGVFALLGWWLWRARAGRAKPTAALAAARPVLVLLGVWLVYGLLQVVPLPLDWLAVLSPKAWQQWTETAAALGDDGFVGPVPLTLEPHASLAEWRLGLALTGVLALTLLLVRTRRRLRLLASTLIVAAVAQAMLASLLVLSGQGLWFIEPAVRAHGTYANPNHLAGFLEMSVALGIGLLIADLAHQSHFASWRQRLRAWVRVLLGRKARLRIYLAIMVIALVMTGSRMGNTAFFASLGIAGMIGTVAFRRSPRPVLVLLVSLVLVDILILGSWFGLDRVRERLEQTVVAEDARYQVGVQSTGYLEDYLWLGSGGGSFYAVFPAYRNEKSIPRHFAHADNDLLELQLEYGVVGSALLGAIAALSLATALRVLWRREDPLLRGMAFATLMGVTAILIHSGTDANLHIPANAALFMVLLALPWLGLTLRRD
jgi:hypothetical protein